MEMEMETERFLFFSPAHDLTSWSVGDFGLCGRLRDGCAEGEAAERACMEALCSVRVEYLSLFFA
jgi:hypothetical protein